MSGRLWTVCVILLLAPAGARADIALGAATTTENGRDVVRLKWMLTGRTWLPAGGFNVYRTANGKRARLNPVPLRPSDTPADANRLLGPGMKLGEVMARALAIPPGTAEKDLALGHAGPAARSSASVFDAISRHVESLRGRPGPQPSTQEIRESVAGLPEVAAYRERIAKTMPPGSARPQTALEAAMEARTHLMVGSLIHSSGLHKALGLSYTDTQVAAGEKIQYALRTIDAKGMESVLDVATAEITVGKDPQPRPPTGLKAHQLDGQTIGLRWDRLSDKEEETFGISSYSVTRTDQKSPATTLLLNLKPIVIADGQSDEPAEFFQDYNVSPGEVTYWVTFEDWFGRKSALSNPLKVTVRDLRSPPAIAQAHADFVEKDDAVTLAWTAEGGAVLYRVSRIDADDETKKVLLTANPIPGESTRQALATTPHISKAIARAPARLGPIRAWLSFTDRKVPTDHYYRYEITAEYVSNHLPSTPRITRTVEVPSRSQPPPPAGLKGAFSKLGSGPASHKRLVLPGKKDLTVRGHALDRAGGVILSWNEVAGTKPITYRVYRATATGFFAGVAAQPAAAGRPRDVTMRAGAVLRYTDKFVNLPIQYYALLGEVEDVTTFADEVSRSHGTHYSYRVVPVSRWGIAGDAAETTVRIPATLPPSIPALLGAAPDKQGRVEVSFAGNPADGEIVAYHILRKEMGGAAAVAPAANRIGAAFERFGVGRRESRVSALARTLTSLKPGAPLDGATLALLHPSSFKEVGLVHVDALAKSARGIFADAQVIGGLEYLYCVRSENSDGLQSDPSNTFDVTLPNRPVVTAGTLDAKPDARGGMRLDWTAAPGSAGYIVQRSVGANAPFLQISGVRSETSFVDPSAHRRRTYIYRVFALLKSGVLSKVADKASSTH